MKYLLISTGRKLSPEQLIVRPRRELIGELVRRPMEERRRVFVRSRSVAARTGDVRWTGTPRLDELALAEMPLTGSTMSTTKSGNYPRTELEIDERFWRVVGLYVAEGHANETSLQWSFHPRRDDS